ncbi:histidine kinase [Herbidospora sp. NEAU-GS84]|uniref:histidine kinase n=1 Tax=Herbidospora solisilvae TaxID=2696284 RepID=A0A7C9J864_9ACTN|nr:nitrate- and nitrite sensing domain-containing protein [Herbidospora solisilvae]NAS26520.1 histidine kinase [Herbidospora solisilvae]
MRLRNSRVRTKVVALLLSLAALWGFAAWVTLREGVNLLFVNTFDQGVAQPSDPLVLALQDERRATVVQLATRRPLPDMAGLRAKTDQTRAHFEKLARGDDVRFASSPDTMKRLDELFGLLAGLTDIRKAVDQGRINREQAADGYTRALDAIFRTYFSVATLDDDEIAKDARTYISLQRAREVLSQEDALLAGAIAAGRFGAGEHAKFVQIVGAQRFQTAEQVGELRPSDRAHFDTLLESDAFTALRQIENVVMERGRTLEAPPVTADQWKQTTSVALGRMMDEVLAGGDRVVERATPVALGVIVRLVLAGGLGLVAVIASIVLSITTARRLIAQLEKLRDAAHQLADERLPGVVERLAHGEKVDVAKEAPPLEFGGDVIGQVGQAFNAVQETAIRTAVEEAELRQSIRDILLSLARRTQSLVHRQLTLLDVMERRETDAEELKDLFRVDHLATRMRRNAENLIVLSGATPARAWRRAVPMVDVVRGALAEVEDYTRVTIMPMGQVDLTGRAVGDVIHLLAEVIENAVSFSPPYTVVQVGGHPVASGYAIEIEDRGLGMTQEDLDEANARILNPPEFNLSSTARLGLYVVSRLAERHGIRVSLKSSPYGGTTAVVLLPSELVIDDRPADIPPAEQLPEALPRLAEVTMLAAPVAQLTRRHPEPEQDTPVAPRVPEATVTEFTPSGLPFRVPQASIAPSLRDAVDDLAEPEEEDDERSPEDIMRIMGSFQSGTRRGRSDAARKLQQNEGDDR